MTAGHAHEPPELPRGVAALTVVPDGRASGWDHLFLPDGVGERLRNQAMFTLLHRSRLDPTRTGLQGLLVLAGPPGTGKTTAARALARETAERLAMRGSTALVDLDTHALPSDLLGESQRNISHLLNQTLPRIAARQAFTIVLVDEVEAFATSRSSASFDTNPADLHRATDAVLTGLDRVAAEWPGVLFLATTNFPQAVDAALLSRADLVVDFPLPDHHVATAILRDSLEELAAHWPALELLAKDDDLLDELAGISAGLDGRRLRKIVLAAVAGREQTALDPSVMNADDLRASASLAAAAAGTESTAI